MPDVSRAEDVKIRALRWFSLVASIGLASYWGWTFSGPYGLLAGWQLSVFGAYLTVVTWLIAWIVVLIPLHLAIGAIARRAGLPFDNVPLHTPAAGIRIRTLTGKHVLSLFGWAFIVGGVISGSYFLVDGYLAGPLSELPVETLYSGQRPPSRYVDLIGQPLRSGEYTVGVGGSALSRSGRGPDYYYFPMVPANWRPGDDVHVVIQSFYEQPSAINGSADHPNRLRGILRRRVPGFPLSRLQGLLNVADDTWLLDETASPEDNRRLGLFLLGGLSLFGVLMIGAARALARVRQ